VTCRRSEPDMIEARARELAGGNHVHGAIPARFWKEAIAEFWEGPSYRIRPSRALHPEWAERMIARWSRFSLHSEPWEREEHVDCVSCPECAFTFDACHEDRDGGYSCPLCAELASKKTLEGIAEKQQNALRIIRENGFVFESLGKEPGNWQHLAFTLYTEICEIDTWARNALGYDWNERPLSGGAS
jgi:hypothetical protein